MSASSSRAEKVKPDKEDLLEVYGTSNLTKIRNMNEKSPQEVRQAFQNKKRLLMLMKEHGAKDLQILRKLYAPRKIVFNGADRTRARQMVRGLANAGNLANELEIARTLYLYDLKNTEGTVKDRLAAARRSRKALNNELRDLRARTKDMPASWKAWESNQAWEAAKQYASLRKRPFAQLQRDLAVRGRKQFGNMPMPNAQTVPNELANVSNAAKKAWKDYGLTLQDYKTEKRLNKNESTPFVGNMDTSNDDLVFIAADKKKKAFEALRNKVGRLRNVDQKNWTADNWKDARLFTAYLRNAPGLRTLAPRSVALGSQRARSVASVARNMQPYFEQNLSGYNRNALADLLEGRSKKQGTSTSGKVNDAANETAEKQRALLVKALAPYVNYSIAKMSTPELMKVFANVGNKLPAAARGQVLKAAANLNGNLGPGSNAGTNWNGIMNNMRGEAFGARRSEHSANQEFIRIDKGKGSVYRSDPGLPGRYPNETQSNSGKSNSGKSNSGRSNSSRPNSVRSTQSNTSTAERARGFYKNFWRPDANHQTRYPHIERMRQTTTRSLRHALFGEVRDRGDSNDDVLVNADANRACIFDSQLRIKPRAARKTITLNLLKGRKPVWLAKYKVPDVGWVGISVRAVSLAKEAELVHMYAVAQSHGVPFFPRMYGAARCNHPGNPRKGYYVVLSEAFHGDLAQWIKTARQPSEVGSALAQVMVALALLHGRKVLHGPIGPNSIKFVQYPRSTAKWHFKVVGTHVAIKQSYALFALNNLSNSRTWTTKTARAPPCEVLDVLSMFSRVKTHDSGETRRAIKGMMQIAHDEQLDAPSFLENEDIHEFMTEISGGAVSFGRGDHSGAVEVVPPGYTKFDGDVQCKQKRGKLLDLKPLKKLGKLPSMEDPRNSLRAVANAFNFSKLFR